MKLENGLQGSSVATLEWIFCFGAFGHHLGEKIGLLSWLGLVVSSFGSFCGFSSSSLGKRLWENFAKNWDNRPVFESIRSLLCSRRLLHLCATLYYFLSSQEMKISEFSAATFFLIIK